MGTGHDDAEAHRLLERLTHEFALTGDDVLAASYAELVEEKGA